MSYSAGDTVGAVGGLVLLALSALMFGKWRWFEFFFSMMPIHAENYRSYVYLSAVAVALVGLPSFLLGIAGGFA